MKINLEPSLSPYQIARINKASNSNGYFSFTFDLDSPSVNPNPEAVCKLFEDEFVARFAITNCFEFQCTISKKRAISQFTVSLTDSSQSQGFSTPFWAYIVAGVGLFLLFLLVVVLILVLLAKRREKPEWQRYKDDDRYVQL